MKTIDLNADIGEGVGDDEQLIPLVTSVNISCGAHAGDDHTMANAVRAALAAGVAIGAHPGYADRAGFGRREHPITKAEASTLIIDQVRKLTNITEQQGGLVSYVKLHGALYHQAGRDAQIAGGVIAGMLQLGRGLALLGPSGSALETAATKSGVRFFSEAFADRRYESAGVLLPRSVPGALIDKPAIAAEQAVHLAIRGKAVAHDGQPVAIPCDSLCVHGDSPDAVAIAAAIHTTLAEAGVTLHAFT